MKQCVLVVDDDHELADILAEALSPDFIVRVSYDGADALKRLRAESFDCLISDIHMPGLDGIALLRSAREHTPGMPVLIMSGAPTLENLASALNLGAIHFLRKPFSVIELREILAQKMATATRSAEETPAERIRSDLNFTILANNFSSHDEVAALLPRVNPVFNTVLSVEVNVREITRIRNFDDMGYRHSIDTGLVSALLSARAGGSEFEIEDAAVAGLLHNIGNLQLPAGLLAKTGKFTPVEFDTMKLHTFYGQNILTEAGYPDKIAMVAMKHHERTDGSGYPRAVREFGIEPLSRIVAVADVFTALTEDRPYRKAFSTIQALEILKRDLKGKLDSEVVANLTSLLVLN